MIAEMTARKKARPLRHTHGALEITWKDCQSGRQLQPLSTSPSQPLQLTSWYYALLVTTAWRALKMLSETQTIRAATISLTRVYRTLTLTIT